MPFKDSSRYSCAVCGGYEWISRDYVWPARGLHCTCGAPGGLASLHAVDCDSVPCPFCQLLDEPSFQEV